MCFDNLQININLLTAISCENGADRVFIYQLGSVPTFLSSAWVRVLAFKYPGLVRVCGTSLGHFGFGMDG